MLSDAKNKTLEERINGIIGVLMEMSQGNYSVQIELSDKNDEIDAISTAINMMFDDINQQRNELQKTFEELKESKEEISKNYDTQSVLNFLLGLQFKNSQLDDILKYTLEQILDISWLSLESKGAIFLVEEQPGILVMKAQNKLAKEICAACAKVEFGKCLCGKAAQSGQVEYANCLDSRHDISYEGIVNHGHYCVPIVSSVGKTIGVINTYLKVGHHRDKKEEEFMLAIANVLASIIEFKKMENEKENLQSRITQSEKMAAIGQLAGGVAHEINNPLGVILGFAQIIAKNVKEGDNLYMPLKSIEREAIRCKNLVGDLLTFSRTAKSKMELIEC